MRLRSLRSFPALLAAALYVLLGVSAAWHAPHFSHGDSTVGADRHQAHEVPVAVDCALCAWKTAAQEFAAAGKPFIGPAAFMPAKVFRPAPAAAGFLVAPHARGPPSCS